MKEGKKVNVLCIFDRNHRRSVVALDHFRNFKGISMGKGNYCSKFKKGKFKTKKLLKITILGEQEHSVQSAERTKTVQV